MIVIRLSLDQLLFYVITYKQRICTQLFTFLEHIIYFLFESFMFTVSDDLHKSDYYYILHNLLC